MGLIKLIIAAALVTLGGIFYISLINMSTTGPGATYYDVERDAQYDNIFQNINGTLALQQEASKDFEEASQKLDEGTIIGLGGGLIEGAKGIAKMVKMPFTTTGAMFNITKDVAITWGVPTYTYNVLFVIMLFGIGGLILAAVLRYRNP